MSLDSNRVAVSPVVTLEPRRRKFHQPVLLTVPLPLPAVTFPASRRHHHQPALLTVPLPKAAQRGMINQYNTTSGGTSPPNLRLLCSVFGTPRQLPLRVHYVI